MNFETHDLTRLDSASAYKLFITAIVPRPIGWISTLSKDGVANAAPFSWFNAVCGDPLMVMAAVGKRKGAAKDTTTNIRDTGEFVVNVATESNAAKMVQSSADYPASVSEFDAAGLTPLPSQRVKPSRIAESPIHIECALEQIIALGNNATDLIIGRCLMLHIDPAVLAEDGMVDVAKLRPIARLGRDEYAVIADTIRYPRPSV
jgi:flavin reductase (DIM6/NTAB) family NADH-FMN oxidoreductase RutF